MANLQKGVSLQLVRVLKLRYRCLLKGFTVQVLRKSVCFGVVDEILLGSEKRAEKG